MRIMVVCGAGASSTFVAQRLRTAALAAGRDLDVRAGSDAMVPDALHDIDLLLVGPHLASAWPRLEQGAATAGVAAAMLPADVFADLDGSRTLELVLRTVPARTEAVA